MRSAARRDRVHGSDRDGFRSPFQPTRAGEKKRNQPGIRTTLRDTRVHTHLGGRLHPELAVAGAEGVEGPDLGVARGVFLAVEVSEKALPKVSDGYRKTGKGPREGAVDRDVTGESGEGTRGDGLRKAMRKT